jgi:hypothetical protein
MRRRAILKGLVTAPAVWSCRAWAQPSERTRRIGVLVSARPDDLQLPSRLSPSEWDAAWSTTST